MSQRPAAKKSTFGAAHPIEHSEETTPEAVEAPPTTLAKQEVAPAPSATSPVPKAKEPKKKAALWADAEIIERIRGAWYHTPTTSGEREASFSDFLLNAALDRTAAREERYFDGKPFPPVPSGQIGSGRKS